MADHSTALVPIETWAFNSPHLRMDGRNIDIGLFCEALIYFDTVYLTFANENQFIELLDWFLIQGQLDEFIAMMGDGSIKIYHHAFISAPILEQNNHYSMMNLQDTEQEKPDYLLRKISESEQIRDIFSHARKSKSFYRILERSVIEVKASSYGNSIDDAKNDLRHKKKCEHIINSFLEDISPLRDLPEVEVVISTQEGSTNITFLNINFDVLKQQLGTNLNFDISSILSGAIQSNKFLWSAAQINSDLYLGSPISKLIGNKLYDTAKYLKNQTVIEKLQSEVSFPDVRSLINSGNANFSFVMEARKRGKKFRDWLQSQNGRDIQALITYHNEIASEAGWRGSKALKLFGALSGATIGAHYGNSEYTIVGAIAGSTLEYVADLGSKYIGGWKPIAFGKWLGERIQDISNDK